MFKKFFVSLLAILFLEINLLPSYADVSCCNRIEHLDIHKNAPCNEVVINNLKRTVKEGNVLEFTFNEQFWSKCHKAGDIIYFDIPEAVYTCEGTLILPVCAKVMAEIVKIEKPKIFNKNARVSLIFRKIIFSNNTCVDIKARPFTKDYKLKEGPWVTAGKIFLSTITFTTASDSVNSVG